MQDCNWPVEDTPRSTRRQSQVSASGSASSPATSQQGSSSLSTTLPLLPPDIRHQIHLGQQHLSRTHPTSNTMDDFVGIFGNIDGSSAPGPQPANATHPVGTVGAAPGLANAGFGQSNLGLGGGVEDTGLIDWLSGGGNIDEATLQLWAADCLSVPTTQTFNAFDSLNSVLLQPTPPQDSHIDPSILAPIDDSALGANLPQNGLHARSKPGSRRGSRSPSRTGSDTPPGRSQADVLKYFHENLSRLVSITGESAPSAFESFTQLANMTAGQGEAGKGLHLSILAWAARHMVNRGLAKYEAVSEKFSSQSMNLINARMEELFDRKGNPRPPSDTGSSSNKAKDLDTEKMTLLAAAIMIMQFKICRGDVWGFGTLVQHLTVLTPHVFRPGILELQPESMHMSFFENLLYHDVLGSFIVNRAPMIPDSIVQHYSGTGLDTLHTLTGVSLPLFSRMHRLSALHRLRRSKKGKGWSDENLVDVVQPAMVLEAELQAEKKRLDELVLAKPHIQSHRYLHEAFRITCLLQLHGFVLGGPPCSLHIRLLVRQALSLLETMCDENLPGLCSGHWVIFLTALCTVSKGQEEDELDDRERIMRIYDDISAEFGFRNVERSRKLVNDVWSRNLGGSIFVDWLDVIEENDWEIFMV
ncbi:hypothetical protein I316_07278 [Kwoniella heveanensis BCC8398]|uniref:Transcription factor domain-containing protein n=1 Tax=Kwoniella heveanensis BCC8398 TaxID=1296120 RepID=A0A1B9GJ21_9TREE|nr:hypothetical protein I316_07278 [Kwoniella heveanensis BCC8398]